MGNSLDSHSCLPYSGGFNTDFHKPIYPATRVRMLIGVPKLHLFSVHYITMVPWEMWRANRQSVSDGRVPSIRTKHWTERCTSFGKKDLKAPL